MSKKWWLVLLIVIVLIVGGYFAYNRLIGNGGTSAQTEVLDLSNQTAVVKRGSLRITVEGTGDITTAREASLTFSSSGKVEEMLVEQGDHVEAGQPLARQDTSILKLKVAQAEASLQSAQAHLEDLMAQPSAEDVASAEAAYYNALEQYNKLINLPTEDEVTIAKVALEKAETALQKAQSAYDRVAYKPNIAMLPQAQNLQNATLDYEKAQAQYKQAIEKPSAEEIAAARSNLEKAKAHLETVKSGPSAEDVTAKQASVKQAEANLEIAKQNLEDATLKAPFDGTVVEVNVEPGEYIGANKVAVVLDDLDHLQATLYIDETDVGQVAVGQKVVVTLDAFPDAELTGKVSEVAIEPHVQSGVVLYPVTVDLDNPPVPVRPGMTCDGQIVAQSKENVLLVPLKALHSFGNRTIVFVKSKGGEGANLPARPRKGQRSGVGTPTGERKGEFASNPVFKVLLEAGFRPARVELGMMTDTQAEVVSGLSEGDVVSTASLESSAKNSGTASANKKPPLFFKAFGRVRR